jgi:3-deoxy-D-manno-octulosonic acid kinase
MLVNAAAGVEPVVPWFEPRYWIARNAVVTAPLTPGLPMVFEHEGQRFELRHHRRRGMAAYLSRDRFLWRNENRTRPIRELHLLLRMHAAELPVPVPVAARYERQRLTYRGGVITHAVPDAESLAERLIAGDVGLATWAAIGRCIRRFHDFGICHADLSAGNILLRGEDQVLLTGFDGSARRAPGMWRDANLARLRSSLDALEDGRPTRRFDDAQWQCLLAAWF